MYEGVLSSLQPGASGRAHRPFSLTSGDGPQHCAAQPAGKDDEPLTPRTRVLSSANRSTCLQSSGARAHLPCLEGGRRFECSSVCASLPGGCGLWRGLQDVTLTPKHILHTSRSVHRLIYFLFWGGGECTPRNAADHAQHHPRRATMICVR